MYHLLYFPPFIQIFIYACAHCLLLFCESVRIEALSPFYEHLMLLQVKYWIFKIQLYEYAKQQREGEHDWSLNFQWPRVSSQLVGRETYAQTHKCTQFSYCLNDNSWEFARSKIFVENVIYFWSVYDAFKVSTMSSIQFNLDTNFLFKYNVQTSKQMIKKLRNMLSGIQFGHSWVSEKFK